MAVESCVSQKGVVAFLTGYLKYARKVMMAPYHGRLRLNRNSNVYSKRKLDCTSITEGGRAQSHKVEKGLETSTHMLIFPIIPARMLEKRQQKRVIHPLYYLYTFFNIIAYKSMWTICSERVEKSTIIFMVAHYDTTESEHHLCAYNRFSDSIDVTVLTGRFSFKSHLPEIMFFTYLKLP